MKKPELRDYGITPEEYGRYMKLRRVSSEILWERFGLRVWLTAGAVGIVTWITTDYFTETAGFYGIVSFSVTAGLLWLSLSFIAKFCNVRNKRMWQNSTGVQIQRYQYALATYLEVETKAENVRIVAEQSRRAAKQAELRKRLNYWRSLRGVQFERALASLYRSQGYHVETTPVTGDQGVDLILKKDGKTIIVQCKGQKGPASPAVVRELFGSFAAFGGAHRAILACTGGFTQGVYEFIRGKPIALLSAEELAEMGKSAPSPQNQQLISEQAVSHESNESQCANCGSRMLLRRGRYSRFWGCSTYPKCTFTRRYNQSRKRR